MQDIELTLKSARVVRAFLADLAQPRYGFELMKMTGLQSGTLYPMLARLHAAGWITRSREDIDPVAEGRPRRTLYALTADAVPVATAQLDAISEEFGAQ